MSSLDTDKAKDVLKEQYKRRTLVKKAKKIVHKKKKEKRADDDGTDEPAWINGSY